MSAASSPRTWSKPKEWDNAILRSWTRSPIKAELKVFLELVEDLGVELPWGPDNPWGVVSNADLRGYLGCSEDTVRRRWEEAEAGGYLRRVLEHTEDGRVKGRVGFVWFRRPTARPVATEAELDRVGAELRAAVDRRRARPRSVPLRPSVPGPGRNPAGDPPATVRGAPPHFCGGAAPGPIEARARSEIQGEAKRETTTTAAPGSGAPAGIGAPGSSSSPLVPIPLGPGPGGASPPAQCRPITEAEASIDPDLMATLAARAVVLFGLTGDRARGKIAVAIEDGRREAKAAGFRFDPGWIGPAMEEAEWRRAAGLVRRFDWGYVRGILGKWAREGGPGEGGPGEGGPGDRASPRAFDPAALLARLNAAGWTLDPNGPGDCRARKLRESAPDWNIVGSGLREEIKRHRAEIVAHVHRLADGKGGGHAPD